ncbi:MAG: HlyD family efflux transporter periplasmic adaptor subunit [Quisquiliibacterium sp.]
MSAASPAAGGQAVPPTGDLPARPRNGKRRRALAMVMLIIVALSVATYSWWWFIGRFSVNTDNAYVGGNVVQVTPQLAGTVTRVAVDDTQLVRAGELLVQLDDADAKVQLASTLAGLGDAVRGVRVLYANAGQAQAALAGREADLRRAHFELKAAQAAVEKARSELTRRETLAARGFVSPEAVQTARTALDATAAQRDAAGAAVSQARTAISAAREQLRAATHLVDKVAVDKHPRVQEAAARVREAFLANARTRIVAPVDGYIARRNVQVGQRVAPGAALMAIVPQGQLWVDANFKESQLEDVRIGQPVTLTSDLYGSNVIYNGTVVGLAMGTGSAFALLPAQNATGNWIKIVQRLPVRVALDPRQVAERPLRIGLSMHAEIDISDRSGPVLAPPAGDKQEGYRTTVFESLARDADALIERVIAENLGNGKS